MNKLKYLIKSINYIFTSIYLIIIYYLLNKTKLIIPHTITNYIVYTLLLIILILGIIKLTKLKDYPNIVSNYYNSFFKDYYIKRKSFYIIYILILIVLHILLRLPNSYGSYYLWIFLNILVITLIIRKLTISIIYKKINIKIDNSIEVMPTKKKRILETLKYIFIYIVISIIITYLFCKINNAFNAWYIIVILSILFFIMKIQFNNPISKYYKLKKKTMSNKIYNLFLIIYMISLIYVSMIIGTYELRDYINYTKKQETKNLKIEFSDNMYKIYKDEEDFKILALSDIHIGGSIVTKTKDLKALEAIKRLVTYTNPDLIIITGDLVYPTPIQTFGLNNQTSLYQLTLFFNNLGIPWTFTYGNHETESYALKSAQELDRLVLYGLSKMYNSNNSLLYYNANNSIHGRSNMIIEIINKDKTINQILYLIDSGDYYSKKLNDYDYIRDDQVSWYKDTLTKIGTNNSSMIFFHIPLTETKTAIDKYLKGSNEVKYYFGEYNETPCTSKYKSKLFDEAIKLGSTKAMFYGHDHKNNISLEYNGIRLTYNLSIDYLATPGIENITNYRGGTLITLKDNSIFDIEQIKLTDTY